MYPSYSASSVSSTRPLPLVRLSNKEKGLYSNLFSRADPEGCNKVEGRAAVEFFKKSGLPVDRLKEIWNLASPNGESYLDRERFYVAVRLIALAQAGKSMGLEAIEQNVEVDLPQFSGFGGADKAESDSYDLSNEEKTRYEQIFASNGGAKGNLTGLEARSIFERTGVDIGALSKIWTLADPQDTGVLNKNQFVVAMHLIYKARQRFKVPDQLPASLIALIAARSQTEGAKGLMDIGGFAETAVPSYQKPVADRSPQTIQPVYTFEAPVMRSVTPPPAPRPASSDFYQAKPAPEDPFSVIPKPEIRKEPPPPPLPRPIEDQTSKDYFSSIPVKPTAPKEDRKPTTDDPAIRDFQRTLKTMELQIEELTEELRSTKKEVRTTREASGQELEDFAKEMRKQRESMERQVEELTKELRAERRTATETSEATKSAAKQVTEAVSGLGLVKAQCEDSLKQNQILSAQMQTALQQMTAQQSKLIAMVMELMQKQTAEISALAKEQSAEARKIPESRGEIRKSAEETMWPQEPQRVPVSVEPIETPAFVPVKEPIRPPEPKRAPIPPEPTKPAEPIKPLPDPSKSIPVQRTDPIPSPPEPIRPVPEVKSVLEVKPVPESAILEGDFGFPKREERKDIPKPDFVPWPDDSKAFKPLPFDPPKKEEDDFEFEIEPKVIVQPLAEPFKPAVSFRSPDFTVKDAKTPDFNFAFPQQDTQKPEEIAKSDFKPDFGEFEFDFPGLPPTKPEASSKEQSKNEESKPVSTTKEGDFGDFKSFDAFKPGFNANFSSGVFNFDTSSVQLKKTVFDL